MLGRIQNSALLRETGDIQCNSLQAFFFPVTVNPRLSTFLNRIPFCNRADLAHLHETHPGKLDLIEAEITTYARLPFSNLAMKASRHPEVPNGLATRMLPN